jgi:hypothetical protein
MARRPDGRRAVTEAASLSAALRGENDSDPCAAVRPPSGPCRGHESLAALAPGPAGHRHIMIKASPGPGPAHGPQQPAAATRTRRGHGARKCDSDSESVTVPVTVCGILRGPEPE